jgi:hypothetical protein
MGLRLVAAARQLDDPGPFKGPSRLADYLAHGRIPSPAIPTGRALNAAVARHVFGLEAEEPQNARPAPRWAVAF